MTTRDWTFPSLALENQVDEFRQRCIEVYRHDANRVEEDAKKESSIAEGGYGRKQIQELIQNASDALQLGKGKIEVRLTQDSLYVANQGSPFEQSGVRGLLYAHLSNKTGEEIGRFGLGFKSVSGISDNPKIYSQSVSFEFDRERTQQTLLSDLNYRAERADVPALRLGWVLNAPDDFSKDPILKDLASWAVTIIKIPLLPGSQHSLEREMEEFDESFCLFTPHVSQLSMISDISGKRREFKASRRGKEVILTNDRNLQTRWLVVSAQHVPSPEALASAGGAARRDVVSVSWAVPLEGATGLGNLSAYFPIKSETTLSGRLNAPWKLSDDRINLIESKFNQEILEEVIPALVVEARPYLIQDGNFGRYLDILPARGRETRSWADSIIHEPIYEALRKANSLPDFTGKLRSPNALLLPPAEVLEPSTARTKSEKSAVLRDLTERWLDLQPLAGDWIHPECVSTDSRRAKSERLMQDKKTALHGKISNWVESIIDVSGNDALQSRRAIRFLAEIYNNIPSPQILNKLTESEVVLLETGIWVQPIVGRCFIRTQEDENGVGFIDRQVTEDKNVIDALDIFGIGSYQDSGQLYDVLLKMRNTTRIDWDEAWKIFRGSSIEELRKGFREILFDKQDEVIKIKDGTGNFVVPSGHYLPGEVIQSTSQDAKYLVDSKYHNGDKKILELLGIRDRPSRLYRAHKPGWLKDYRKEFEKEVGLEFGMPLRDWGNIDMGENSNLLGPLDHFPNMSDTNRAAITKFILTNSLNPYLEVINRPTRKSKKIIHPEYWLIQKFGLLQTTLGLSSVQQAFVLNTDDDNISDIVPAIIGVDLPKDAHHYLNFRTSISELTPVEFAQLVIYHRSHNDEAGVGKTYAWWCTYYPDSPPREIHVHANGDWFSLPPGQVAVSSVEETENIIEGLGIPTLNVPEAIDCENLSEYWGLMDPSRLPIEFEFQPSEEALSLIQRFPTVENFDREDIDDLDFQPCEALYMTTRIPGSPQVRVPVHSGRQGTTLFSTARTLRDQLRHVLEILEEDTSKESLEAHLKNIQARANRRLHQRLRSARSHAERIAIIAGDSILISIIPKPATEFLKSDGGQLPTGEKLADICLKMYGPKTLEKICKSLPEDHPIRPLPRSWRGTYAAKEWAQSLGFGEEFAGRKSDGVAPLTELVEGPTDPGVFHDYQEKVSENLRQMLVGNTVFKRGLITLPTGAGKTRVSVQTIIECIARGEMDDSSKSPFSGPILWLANSQELCEQAIDTWSYLWRAFGRKGTKIALTRHYDRHFAEEEPDTLQIVVGTFQKTKQGIGNPALDWLKDAAIVVIDEAHSALAKSYTEILEWTERSRSQRDKLLLGLSATPYRGSSDSSETERLLKRFDANILDAGVFGKEEPMVRLQRDKVLSHVTMEIIRNEEFVPLTEQEIKLFKETSFLPPAKATQLGQDTDRTRRIIESIKEKPRDWSILVFAASVENAETIATALTLEGIPAAAISGTTDDDERQIALERFKSGELRVLTNYAVLTQGFDAPKTRAVYITRPTTSEVRYLQMIGRGLRGPKNGGTENVHIVNVLDNLQSFDLSINYEPFSYLADEIQEDELQEGLW